MLLNERCLVHRPAANRFRLPRADGSLYEEVQASSSSRLQYPWLKRGLAAGMTLVRSVLLGATYNRLRYLAAQSEAGTHIQLGMDQRVER